MSTTTNDKAARHPTATTSLRWGIAMLVAGALIVAFGNDIYSRVAGTVGGEAAEVVLRLASTVAYVLTPLGAALVGAAVVIIALAPRVPEPGSATWPAAE